MSKTKKAPQKQIITKESWYRKNKVQLIISVFTFLLFSNSLFNGYNLDDELVTRNHRTTSKGISAIPEIFTSPYYQDDMGYAYEYRPVVHTTFAIEHTFFGERPFVGHLINLLLYILLCLVIFKLLMQIGMSIPLSLFVTLLFSAHTSHTEVVCSIKNRDEILGLLFSGWGMLLAIKSAREKKRIGLLISTLLFALAMLSKGGYILFALLIPLAVVLFTSASFSWSAMFTFAMSMVGYFLLDVSNVSAKNYYLLFVNIAVTLFYLWTRKVDLIGWVKAGLNEKRTTYKPQQDQSIETESIIPYVISSAIVVTILAIKFFLLHTVNPSIFLLLLVLLAGIVGSYFKSKIWNLELGVLTGSGLFYLHLLVFKMYLGGATEAILGVLIMYIAFSTKLKIRVSFFAPYTLAITMLLMSPNAIPGYVLFAILSLTQHYKRSKWILFVMFFIPILLIINQIIVDGFSDFDNAPILELVFVLVFYLRTHLSQYILKYGILFFGVLLAITISITVFNQHLYLHYATIGNEVIQKDLGNAVEVLKSTKTDRPLSYIEYPLPPGTPLAIRVGTALEVIGHYIQKTILPYPLAFYYGFRFIEPITITSSKALIWLGVIVVLMLTSIYSIIRYKKMGFAMLLIVSSLLLISGFFMPAPGVIGDRYLFLPSLGWSILLGNAFFYLFKFITKSQSEPSFNTDNTLAKFVLLIPLIVYSTATFARNFDWKDHLTLMRKDISHVSNSAQAHNLLALNIMKHASEPSISQQEQAALTLEATAHFKKSFEIYPKTFNVAFDLGRVYAMVGKADSAIYYYQQAAKLDTTYNQLYLNIGELLYAQGRLSEAIPFYKKYIALSPTVYDGYGKLSFIYYQLKDYENSIATNKLAAERIQNLPDPYINIGQLYIAMQETDVARYWLLKADSIAQGQSDQIKQMLQNLQSK
jgi:tetratricopeptide (TPR) repeat protein